MAGLLTMMGIPPFFRFFIKVLILEGLRGEAPALGLVLLGGSIGFIFSYARVGF